jgi:hypothetical protein
MAVLRILVVFKSVTEITKMLSSATKSTMNLMKNLLVTGARLIVNAMA